MQEFLLYRPYRGHTVIAFLCFVLSVLSLCAGILFFATSDMYFFFLCSVVEFFFAFCCYRDGNLIIAFGQYEIQVFNNKLLQRYFWSDFSELYYARNNRNRLYFVLSNEELSEKQIKHLCNHEIRKYRPNELVFCADYFSYRETLLNMIKKHEINIHK